MVNLARYTVLTTLLAFGLGACQSAPVDTASLSDEEQPPGIVAPEIEWLAVIEAGDAPFDAPYGIDIGLDGRVYVFDTNNQRVQIFKPDGEYLFSWGEAGDAPGQFNSLGFGSLAIDRAGNVYVVDNGNFRVQKFDPDGGFMHAFGSEGEGSGSFSRAIGIATSDQGEVFVTDDAVPIVQVFNDQGAFLRQFGGPDQLEHATGITVEENGTILVADYSRKRVTRFDAEGTALVSWEIGATGPVPGTPEGLSVDAIGRIYISDYDRGLIEVYSAEGEFLVEFGERELKAPVDIAINADGVIYISDQRTNQIQIYQIQ